MIYLIDEDKSVRRGFELFLKSEGMDYVSIESAEDFLALFKPETFDVLVLDLCLPRMSGEALIKKLVSNNINIPIVIVTASDDQRSREFCRKHGVKAYLRKPVDGDALIDTIKYILASESSYESVSFP